MTPFDQLVLLLLGVLLLVVYVAIGAAVYFTRNDYPPYAFRVFLNVCGMATCALGAAAVVAMFTHSLYLGA